MHSVKVWDPLIRIFHWSLVLLFAVAYFTGDDDGMLHIYAGYGIAGLVVLRLVWGVVGTRHARFSDFVYGRHKVVEYVRSLLDGTPQHHLGHNPLGGWMVVLLLAGLALTSWSGLEAYAAEGKGPLATMDMSPIPVAMAHGDADGHEGSEHEGDGFWKEIHELLANLTLGLVLVHIAGVVVASRLHRENLVKAMITGRKEVEIK
jgi:cytochrome b